MEFGARGSQILTKSQIKRDSKLDVTATADLHRQSHVLLVKNHRFAGKDLLALLPDKVQNAIYEQLVLQQKPIQARLHRVPVEYRSKIRNRSGFYDAVITGPEPALARVNKRLRKYILAMHYGKNTFKFKIVQWLRSETVPWTAMLKNWKEYVDTIVRHLHHVIHIGKFCFLRKLGSREIEEGEVVTVLKRWETGEYAVTRTYFGSSYPMGLQLCTCTLRYANLSILEGGDGRGLLEVLKGCAAQENSTMMRRSKCRNCQLAVMEVVTSLYPPPSFMCGSSGPMKQYAIKSSEPSKRLTIIEQEVKQEIKSKSKLEGVKGKVKETKKVILRKRQSLFEFLWS